MNFYTSLCSLRDCFENLTLCPEFESEDTFRNLTTDERRSKHNHNSYKHNNKNDNDNNNYTEVSSKQPFISTQQLLLLRSSSTDMTC